MKTILVVDDMAVFREPIAASLRLAGYETLSACDGEEALRITRADHPDLVLLDVSMPKMDGLTYLKLLRADSAVAATPVILLTALSEKKHIVAAGSLGVKNYLLKSRFRLGELLERIKKIGLEPTATLRADAAPATANAATTVSTAFSTKEPSTGPASVKASRIAVEQEKPIDSVPRRPATIDEVPSLLTREQFIECVEGVLETKTFSGVVTEVMAMASSPRADTSQLATLIAQDPMLSARVIQTANSATYRSSGAVATNITDAIKKVGCAPVRNIAAALGVFDCMPEAGADGFNPIRCWQHSFAVAQICEQLAGKTFAKQTGVAYVVGLCHDLGEIFIRTQFGAEYKQFLETVEATQLPAERIHGRMLGMTHSQMINAVLKCMSLPDAIRKPIEIFHSSTRSQSTDPLARILWLAENFANGALLASSPGSTIAPVQQSFCQAAVGDRNPIGPDGKSLRSEILSLTISLAKVSRAEEAKLMVPLFSPRPSKVWIAREPSISSFDPTEAALGSIAEVTVDSRLPARREAEEMDALVIVAPFANVAGFSEIEIERILGPIRSTGRKIPVMTISCEEGPRNSAIPIQTSVALSALASLSSQSLNEMPMRPLNRPWNK